MKIGIGIGLWLNYNPPGDAGESYTSIDFSSYGIGAGAPTGWTDRWTDVSAAWAIKALGGATGGQVLEELSASGFSLLSLDAVNGTSDSDVKFRGQFNGTQLQNYIVVRGSGDTTTKQGYVCGFNDSSDTMNVSKLVNNVNVPLGNAMKAILDAAYFCMRFRVEGTALKAKAWVGDYDDEPGSWDIEITDESISASGWIGVGGHRSEGTGLQRIFDRFDYVALS